MTKESIEYPVDQPIDLAHTLVKGAIGIVPGGSVLSELFQTFIPQQFSQRKEEWGRTVTTRLNHLLGAGFISQEDLSDNPTFLDALAAASLAALKTSNRIKREALASAVSSSALQLIEPDLEQIYIRYVDELTGSHLQLLRTYQSDVLSESAGSADAMETKFLAIIGQCHPELEGNIPLIFQLCNDLSTRSLIAVPPKGLRSLGGINFNCMTITATGIEFLRFISEAREAR